MKKNNMSIGSDNKVNSQYQNFAHLLYRQGARIEPNNNPNNAIAVSSYKSQNHPPGSFSHTNNTRTVPVTSFPNGRVTTMLQNSYSNSASQNTSASNYSRAHLNTNTIKNYRIQNAGRQNLKQNELSSSSFSRSKSVFKDQEYARNGSTGSRSTAAHSSGLPPAFKKNSSISADYGKTQVANYQYSSNGSNNNKIH